MSKIIRSGYLQIHLSNVMARIVFSDGNWTQMLVTKRQALEIGEGLVGVTITDIEWLAIKQQIHQSPLVDKNRGLEEISNTMQSNLNDLQRWVESFLKSLQKEHGAGEEWKGKD